MKSLPTGYWLNGYQEIPSAGQRYWVQRCLELLDIDTGLLWGLPSVNSASLLRELVATPSMRPDSSKPGSNARTLHFLVRELHYRLATDRALHDFVVANQGPEQWKEFCQVVEDVNRQGSELFTANGASIQNSGSITRQSFTRSMLEAGAAKGDSRGLFQQIHSLIESNRPTWLRSHEDVLRKLLTTGLPSSLLELHQDMNAELLTLECVTQSWLIELLTTQQCGPIYLAEIFKDTFLERSREGFQVRLDSLFGMLRVEKRSFTVFMRLQARRELAGVEQIDQVRLSVNCPAGAKLLKEIQKRGRIKPDEVVIAGDFFYNGKVSPRLIFVQTEVEAETIGSAARVGLKNLDVALRQARFEFERSNLSIDNAMYIYDSKAFRLERFTRRQAQADQYAAPGNTLEFERLSRELTKLQNKPGSGTEQNILGHVTDLSLQWHRHGVESIPTETKFLSHWIELEQLLRAAESLNLTGLNAGDAVVRAVATALRVKETYLALNDLWGDLMRCDVLGPKPYTVQQAGQVRFTVSFQARELRRHSTTRAATYRRWKEQPIDIEIRQSNPKNTFLKGYRIPSGFNVFAEDGSEIRPGDWLAGPDLRSAQYPGILKMAFAYVSPRLVNMLYLIRCWQQEVMLSLEQSQLSQFTDSQWISMRRLPREHVQFFARCQRLLGDLYETYKVSFTWPNDAENIDLFLVEKGCPPSTGLRPTVRYLAQQWRQIEQNLEAIEGLGRLAQLMAMSAKTPNAIWFELFRDCQPNFEVFWWLVKNRVTDLIKELPDQPLLRARVLTVHFMLQTASQVRQDPDHHVCTLDRMRRTRNAMTHTGSVPDNLSLLTRELYHYSKLYVRAVIRNLATGEKPLDEALYLKGL